jgi:hypothetical protein
MAGIASSMLVLGALLSSAPASASPLSGQHVDFDAPPAWTISGAWASDGSLVLVDAALSKVLLYKQDGKRLNALANPVDKNLAFPKPAIIQRLERGGYLLEDQDGHLVRLDENYKPLSSWDLLASAKGPQGELGSVLNWISVNEDVIVAFGDVKQGDRWFSAFLRINLSHPADFEVLQEVSETASRFYLLGNPYIAAVRGEAFYLVMDDPPYLVRAGDGIRRRVAGLSTSSFHRPQLPSQRGEGGVKAAYSVLERASMPVGLYGWNGYLYLLSRETVEGRAGLAWVLAKIDPDTERIMSSRVLDSTASHLSVVPGQKFWAFLEKGPVRGVGLQNIPGMLLVRTAEIEK